MSKPAASDWKVVSNGRGELVRSNSLTHLAIGTMETTNLASARRFYEQFLGFECVQYAPGRLLMRDRRAKYLMEHGDRDFFLIDVREVPLISNPQKMLNHWGLAIRTAEDVDRLHAYAKENAEAWWINKVRPVTAIHGSHGFMLVDKDDNWWEIEYRSGMTNDLFFSNGNVGARTVDPAMKVDPPLHLAEIQATILPPDSFLSHGTADLADIATSQAFYEEILNLRCVHHVDVATFTAGGGDFAVVGVEVGRRAVAQTLSNRWILLVEDDAALLAIRQRALSAFDRLSIGEVGEIGNAEDGGRSFLIQSPDANWFEISTKPRDDYVQMFNQSATG